jgi:hypothetical protein
VVKLRRKLPTDAANAAKLELVSEALLEASLDCHRWKNDFVVLAGPDLPSGEPNLYADVWDLMLQLWVPHYRGDVYQRFLPLFTSSLSLIQARFDRLLRVFADVLPPDFRVLLVRASRQLEVERPIYEALPRIGGHGLFHARFAGVVRVLADVDRDADRRRNALVST